METNFKVIFFGKPETRTKDLLLRGINTLSLCLIWLSANVIMKEPNQAGAIFYSQVGLFYLAGAGAHFLKDYYFNT